MVISSSSDSVDLHGLMVSKSSLNVMNPLFDNQHLDNIMHDLVDQNQVAMRKMLLDIFWPNVYL